MTSTEARVPCCLWAPSRTRTHTHSACSWHSATRNLTCLVNWLQRHNPFAKPDIVRVAITTTQVPCRLHARALARTRVGHAGA